MDLALSEGQVARWYRLSLEEAASSFPARGTVRSVALRLPGKGVATVRFLVHPRLREASSGTLRHLAGLAEMRRLLGVPPEAWTLGAEPGSTIPDALWGDVVVEYDAGEYPRPVLRNKLAAFERRAPLQVWGTVSDRRRELILRLAGEMSIRNLHQVLVAPWL